MAPATPSRVERRERQPSSMRSGTIPIEPSLDRGKSKVILKLRPLP
jgi:hypothetical protein